VEVPGRLWGTAARLSLSYGVEGHRSDLTMIKAARALCALEGRSVVTAGALVRTAEMALIHRVKHQELDRPGLFDSLQLQQLVEELEDSEAHEAPVSGEVKKKTQAL
jgi:Mg-chelatase subunit ChlI